MNIVPQSVNNLISPIINIHSPTNNSKAYQFKLENKQNPSISIGKLKIFDNAQEELEKILNPYFQNSSKKYDEEVLFKFRIFYNFNWMKHRKDKQF